LYAVADELGKQIGGSINYLNKSDFKEQNLKRNCKTNSKS